jgi:OPA family sugar phosphate sensor protein UhpC-like MFS transporter
MSTPLTAAHRSWRMRVFVATWLSYVGFYFCRKPFSLAKDAIEVQNGWDKATTVGNIGAAYLIAYAIGQFLASHAGTRLGPRRNLLIGMALSIAVTVAMGVTVSPWVMAGLVAVNGIAQATGWSGNVGTMASWFHKHERGRIMGMWSTNFTIGSLLSGFVIGWVLGDTMAREQPWQWAFYTGAIVLAVVWVVFHFWQRNRPEDVGLPAIDDPVTEVDESRLADEPTTRLSRQAWINVFVIGGFYFFSKLIRYAMWSWSAYFLANNYGLTGKQASLYSILFDLFGIPGVFITGWLSDRYFESRRAGIALIMMIGMTVVTGLLMVFGDRSVTVFAILLCGVGFFLYGPDALLTGAGAMDVGGRKAAVFATGTIAIFGALGPVVQEVVIPRVYDPKDLGLIFVILFASSIMAAFFCALLVWRNRRGGKGI